MYTYQQVYEESLKYFKGDELAASVFAGKYSLQDEKGNYLELTPDDMHKRLTKEFARIEKNYTNPMSEEEIYELFANFKYVVPQGSPMSGIGNDSKIQSISNCFVISSPEDSYGGILKADQEQVQIMKRRGGVGFDVSTIRPKGMFTSNAAKTTDGIEVFLERFSNSCREVAQGGRRGALMLSLSIHHPQVMDFIKIKRDLKKVTGANISVRVTDEFMKAVKSDTEYIQRWPVDSDTPEVHKHVSAREVWDALIEGAHASAEPGVLFWDTAKRMTPSDAYSDVGFGSVSTNPCVTGDTIIAVADGTNKQYTIKELASSGKDIPVYCCDDNGNIAIQMMRNPRLTKSNAQIYKVTLDDGSVIRTTGNHKLRNSDGEYVRVDEMHIGESLHISYIRDAALDDIWKNSNSRSSTYKWLKSHNKKSMKSEHRMIYEFHNGNIPKGNVIHHLDFDSQNNHLSNLKIMTKKEHDDYHGSLLKGDNNPMRRAQNEWSEDRWKEYKDNLSKVCAGELNGNSNGLNNDELLKEVSNWIKELEYIPTVNEYLAKGYPNLNGFRLEKFDNINDLIAQASKIVNVTTKKIPTTSQDKYLQLAYVRSLTDLPLSINSNNQICVTKACEICNNQFEIHYGRREQGFCSHACSLIYTNNNKDIKKKRTDSRNKNAKMNSEKNKLDQMKAFTYLRFKLNREPLLSEWDSYCKDNNIVRRLKTKHGFQNWQELKEASNDFNHRVVSIELDGYEDVYTGTVDKYHNYYTYGKESTSQYGKSQICLINSKQCGEIILSPYDSCRLMLMNLTSFVKDEWTPKASFDWGKFRIMSRKAQRLMDDMIDIEIEQIDKILAKIDSDPENEVTKTPERVLWQTIRNVAKNGRRTGLGVTGLGDTIAMLGQRYGSDKSIETVEEIYKWLSLASYEASIQLAKERGAFPVFNVSKEEGHEFLERVISSLTEEVQADYRQYGRRNIANTTTAPAGSVSCLTQTTSGIEPAFMLYYKRRKKVQNGEKVMFVDDLGDEWTEFNVYHHGFKQWLDSDHGTTASEDDLAHAVAFSPYHGATANEIDWRAKVKLQSVAQKWICHAISNTTNLPADIDVETVKDIYMLGWELGCKGVTVYRDGCRSGVLVSTDDKKESKKQNTIIQRDAPKRPETLDCDINQVSIKGDKWVVLVGLMDGMPYEVIGGKAEMLELPKKVKSGKLLKNVSKAKTMPSKYDLIIGEGDDSLIVKDVVSQFDNANYAGYTRVISTSLRHGVPVQYLVEQMQKDKEADLFSFSKVISRCLKSYIKDGTAVKKVCSDCGAEGSLVYQEGCVTCKSCGSGKCG